MAHQLTLLPLLLAASLRAEAPAQQLACTTTPLTGQVYNVGDVLTALENGARQGDLATQKPDAFAALVKLANQLREARAEEITVPQMAELIVNRRVSLSDVARWDPQTSGLLSQKWFRDAVLDLPLIANGSVLPALRAKGVPPATIQTMLAPTFQLGRRVRDCATAKSDEKLRRIEIKYGEDSPSLNFVEVGANYLAQFVPELGPTVDGWPSRYEIIAAYRPMELTVFEQGDDPTANIVSAGQLGLRWYHWNPNWGSGSRIDQLKRPRHASFGAYAIGPDDRPLQKPWDKGNRFGAFVGWGDFHAAYVFEAPRRVLIGHGKLLIPYVF